MKLKIFALPIVVVLLVCGLVRAEVTIERSEHGAVIKVDGKLFTEYHTKAGQDPALWPVNGPTGKPVTRGFPFLPAAKDGTNDHPHHQSVWMNHGDVNGLDFWGSNRNDRKEGTVPGIKHREFVKMESHGSTAELITRNDWMNGDKRICEDERAMTFGTSPDGSRWIDFDITIKASDGDVVFGDTKEGAFGVRVADSMRVDAKKGGKIVNSEGLEDENAWGLPARWVDYAGPVDGETVGITLMSHPKSFKPTPRWHVRTYGLFAANPFGQKDFPKPEAAQQGPTTIKKGDSLTLKYRVYLHRGGTENAKLERVFQDFANSK